MGSPPHVKRQSSFQIICDFFNCFYLSFTRLIYAEPFSMIITFSNFLTCYERIDHAITSENLNANSSSNVQQSAIGQRSIKIH